MSGITKRKFIAENIRIGRNMKRQLNNIYEILPKEYDGNILLEYYKYYYPNEWDYLEERYRYYKEKDNFLIKHGKKSRYNILSQEEFFFRSPKVKHLLSRGVKTKHRVEFNERDIETKRNAFSQKRMKLIEKHEEKVNQYTKNQQHIDPLFIDILEYAYHRKGVRLEEKLEIVNELFKYETPHIVMILQKINDAEHNDQIRELVFKHLQDGGHYVKIRKKFKGKKKKYYTETFEYDMKPIDLVNRINENLLQDKKSYHFFISHSAKDSDLVRTIISKLNFENKTCYCDWMSDTDFLKREFVSDYTKDVLKRRIEQSEAVLFIKTENSYENGLIPSDWIRLEIEYAKEIGKNLLIMDYINDTNSIQYHENNGEI